jgi:hypothetical protein
MGLDYEIIFNSSAFLDARKVVDVGCSSFYDFSAWLGQLVSS